MIFFFVLEKIPYKNYNYNAVRILFIICNQKLFNFTLFLMEIFVIFLHVIFSKLHSRFFEDRGEFQIMLKKP